MRPSGPQSVRININSAPETAHWPPKAPAGQPGQLELRARPHCAGRNSNSAALIYQQVPPAGPPRRTPARLCVRLCAVSVAQLGRGGSLAAADHCQRPNGAQQGECLAPKALSGRAVSAQSCRAPRLRQVLSLASLMSFRPPSKLGARLQPAPQ